MQKYKTTHCSVLFGSISGTPLFLYKSLVIFIFILLCACETWTPFAYSEKSIQMFETQMPEETSPHLLLGTQDQLPCRSTGTWRLSRGGNPRGWGTYRVTTASSPKPSFSAPWRVGDAVVGRGSAGWTTSKSGHPCPCRIFSRWLPAEKDWKRISDKSSVMSPPSPSPYPSPSPSPTTKWLNDRNKQMIQYNLFFKCNCDDFFFKGKGF